MGILSQCCIFLRASCTYHKRIAIPARILRHNEKLQAFGREKKAKCQKKKKKKLVTETLMTRLGSEIIFSIKGQYFFLEIDFRSILYFCKVSFYNHLIKCISVV